MAGQTAVSQAEAKRSPEVVRILRSTLEHSLLGERVTMDFYARVGFRLLGVPGWVDPTSLATSRQQLSNIARLDPARLRRHAIYTIPDEHLDNDTLLAAVDRLESPRHRFIAELFWPHLEGAEFEAVRSARRLGEIAAPIGSKTGGRNPLARAKAVHAQALAHHCQAIDAELVSLDNRGPAPQSQWDEAVRAWRELLGINEFWRYLELRVEKMDDPRIRKDDVEKARQEIPRIVLGPQELLAERYANLESYEDCARHLNIIRRSGFAEEVVNAALWNAVRRVADTRLGSLCRRAKETFDGIKDKIDRGEFAPLAAPFVQEAEAIRDLLVERLELSQSLLQQSAFDTFAKTMREAEDKKLIYAGPERQRNLLYSARLSKRLMSLPLSPDARRNAEREIKDINRFLYADFGFEPDALPEGLACFFASGEDADPDDSLIIPMYRVTQRKVEVDRLAGSAGLRVAWDNERLLVPRSTRAKSAHGKTIEVEVRPADYNEAQRAAAASIEKLKAARDATLSDRRSRHEADVREVQQKEAAALAQFKSRYGRELDDARAAVARLGQEEKLAVAADLAANEGRRAAIRKKHAAAIEAATHAEVQAQNGMDGLLGILKIELPAAVVCGIPIMLLAEFGLLALALITVAAVLIGKGIRTYVKRKAGAARRDAEAARDRELADFERTTKASAEAVRAPFAERGKAPRALIEAATKEEAVIRDSARQSIATLEKQRDQDVKKATADFEAKAKEPRGKIVHKVAVKNLSQQKEFPAFAMAKKKGFREGEKPTDSEMDMTESERNEARLRLGLR